MDFHYDDDENERREEEEEMEDEDELDLAPSLSRYGDILYSFKRRVLKLSLERLVS